jgi:hypothetical protein
MTLVMREIGVKAQLLAHPLLTIKNDVMCPIKHFLGWTRYSPDFDSPLSWFPST